jgi:hypothetical protein
MSLQTFHLRGELFPSYRRHLKHSLGFFIHRVVRTGPTLPRIAPVFSWFQLGGTPHRRSHSLG